MSDRPPERWILALDVRDDGAPPAATMKRLLKHIWRRWGIRCRGFSEDQQKFKLMKENERLRKIVAGMAERIAQQSELLSRAAEKSSQRK